MTNLVDSLKAPPRAEVAAGQRPAGAVIAQMLKDECGMRSKSTLSIQHSSFSISRPLRSGGSLSRGYWGGLTLIEMLVALAVTLVMMAAVVNLFANMSASIRNRRAAIETGSQLRQVRNRLAMDLSGATCRGSTWQDPAENQGYIEIIEGEWSDKNPSSQIIPANIIAGNGIDPTISLIPASQAFDSETGAIPGGLNIGAGAVTDGRALGDWDDVLALTVRSESEPFKITDDMGTPNAADDVMVESELAEVAWFAVEKPASTPAEPDSAIRKIHRRVRLIAPWRGPWNSEPTNISAHHDATSGKWVANTLGDLTKRENRMTRDSVGDVFPFSVNLGRLLFNSSVPNSPIEVETRALSNALAFDVRVFDPGAPLVEASGSILEPNDFGWPDAIGATTPVITGYGAYCDLGWGRRPNTATYIYPKNATIAQPLGPGVWPSIVPVPSLHMPHRAGWRPLPTTPPALVDFPAVYDTWSYHYENDGIDQDVNTVVDQGANGLDDDNANGVDDRGERETAPPYDVPLRGVKVILRVYEPDARQIRESSVTHSFKQ